MTTYYHGTKVMNSWNLPENPRNSDKAHYLAMQYTKRRYQVKNGVVIWTGWIDEYGWHTNKGKAGKWETMIIGNPPRNLPKNW